MSFLLKTVKYAALKTQMFQLYGLLLYVCGAKSNVMCLNSRFIKSPVERLPNDGSTPLFLSVNCGECSECVQLKQNEYTFRSYYEAKECLASGGFVYFDTLTYSDDNVPHVSDFCYSIERGSALDFMCFSVEHYQNFMKVLRTRLTNDGYDVAKNLKYFLTTEYGENEMHTHRPHFHVLFYSRVPGLTPIYLSQCISELWKYGRTDGIGYKPVGYVLEHVFGFMGNSSFDDVILRNICNYVAKYVNKDSEFLKVVKSRFSDIEKEILHKLWIEYGIKSKADFNQNFREYYKKIKGALLRQFFPFHKQSIGFGSGFLKYNTIEEIEATGMIKMHDCKRGWITIPVPMYFKRKLWYNLFYTEDGKPRWYLNEAGIEHNRRYVYKQLDDLAVKFEDWYQNLGSYYNVKSSVPVDVSDVKDYIDVILNGRSWHDFAAYILCYRGRYIDKNNCTLLPLPLQVQNIYKSSFSLDFVTVYHESLWRYGRERIFVEHRDPVLSAFGVRDEYNRVTPPNPATDFLPEPYDLYQGLVITERFAPEFSRFDELFNIYMSSTTDFREQKDIDYWTKVDLKRKQKALKKGIEYQPNFKPKSLNYVS